MISAKVSGQKELLKKLNSKKIASIYKKELKKSVAQLHKLLGDGIKSQYTVKRKLNKVKRTTNAVVNGSIVSTTLEYIHEPVPLSSFQHKTKQIKVKSFFVDRRTKILRVLETQKARQILVRVKRRKGFKVLKNSKGIKGFKPKGSSGLFVRIRKETSIKQQLKGKSKSPLKLLFGPSLSQMANTVYNNRPKQVQNVLDSLTERVNRQI